MAESAPTQVVLEMAAKALARELPSDVANALTELARAGKLGDADAVLAAFALSDALATPRPINGNS